MASIVPNTVTPEQLGRMLFRTDRDIRHDRSCDVYEFDFGEIVMVVPGHVFRNEMKRSTNV